MHEQTETVPFQWILTGLSECRRFQVLMKVKCVLMCGFCITACAAVLPPFLTCAQNLWQPVTVAFLFQIISLFISSLFCLFIWQRKLLQLRLQVVFLTWSFLSKMVINEYIYIFTFIFQCNKEAIMYCMCVSSVMN